VTAPESKSSKRLIVAAERQARALELRKAGWTFARIAATVGWAHESGARYSVTQALDALREDALEGAEKIRTLEIERLNELHRVAYEKALTGDLDAIDRALRIAARRAKLLGLDAPTRIEQTKTAGAPDDEAFERLMRDRVSREHLLAACGGTKAVESKPGRDGRKAKRRRVAKRAAP